MPARDLRRSFAVNTILDAYGDGDDPGARPAILSTYLGHFNPAHTYWYLSASPELMKLAVIGWSVTSEVAHGRSSIAFAIDLHCERTFPFWGSAGAN
jgi:hypothetical protein